MNVTGATSCTLTPTATPKSPTISSPTCMFLVLQALRIYSMLCPKIDYLNLLILLSHIRQCVHVGKDFDSSRPRLQSHGQYSIPNNAIPDFVNAILS